MQIHPKLSHLSESQVTDLVAEYYAGDAPVKDLIQRYEIPIRGNNILQLLPPEETEHECNCCGFIMYRERISRNPSQYSSQQGRLFCTQCGHLGLQAFSATCPCETCEEVRQAKRSEIEVIKDELLQNFYESYQPTPIQLEQLTFRQRIYLAAIVRSSWSAEDGLIHAHELTGKAAPAASTRLKANEMLNALITVGALRLGRVPIGDAVIFANDEMGRPTSIDRWYPLRVEYAINIVDVEGPASEAALSYLPEAFLDERPENTGDGVALWLEIGMEECASYLQERCDRLGLDFEVGGKTESHIKKALEWFSIGQVRNLIWMSTKDVLVYIKENRIPRPIWKNLPAKFLLNKAERARANDWELKPFRRPRDRNTLIEVVAHQLLGIGDHWETKVIDRSAL